MTTIRHAREEGAQVVSDAEPPRLVLVFQCEQPLAPGARFTLRGVDEVQIGRGAPRESQRTASRIEINLRGVDVSRQHARLRRCAARWELADLESKNGTLVNGLPVERATLVDGDLIEVGPAMMLYRAGREGHRSDGALDLAATSSLPAGLRTLSLDLERRVAPLVKIAPWSVPVLIRGETGTGKELTARAIHELSGRRGPFVPVNCGALPRTLIESELFGAKRGAFSGAREDREGLVQRADGGTLFLDEIAELPEESQVALLRVLQEGEVRPVGSCDDMRVDVRFVAATHQDLEARIAEGRFRQDLYARLVGYVATLPPLRARREDIGTLIGTILERIVDDPSTITLQRQAARALLFYPYPHNIRELEQALRSAVALSGAREIGIEHLPDAIRLYRPSAPDPRTEAEALRDRLTELLREHHGNITAVARRLGKSPMQIRRWCQRYSIQIAEFRD